MVRQVAGCRHRTRAVKKKDERARVHSASGAQRTPSPDLSRRGEHPCMIIDAFSGQSSSCNRDAEPGADLGIGIERTFAVLTVALVAVLAVAVFAALTVTVCAFSAVAGAMAAG